MGDLISRSALIEKLRKDRESVYSHVFCHTDSEHEEALAIDLEQMINNQPTVDAVPVVHAEWMLEAHKEPNYHWSVKAECSNCCHENGEVWGAYFPDVPDSLAKDTALLYARKVKISNFCPNCGAKMDGKKVQE